MDSSILVGVLQDLGVNISASTIYDFLKGKFGSQSSVKKTVLEKELSAFLKIHGVKAEAATVIKALADSGFLSIKGAELVAPDGILIGAGEGARFSFGENSVSKTAKTAIHAYGNARVEGCQFGLVEHGGGLGMGCLGLHEFHSLTVMRSKSLYVSVLGRKRLVQARRELGAAA